MLFNLVGIPLQLSCKRLKQNKKTNMKIIYHNYVMQTWYKQQMLNSFYTRKNNIPDWKMTDSRGSHFQVLISL